MFVSHTFFVGFEHDYINTEKRETNTDAGSQVMASQTHLGIKHRVPKRNAKGVLSRRGLVR